MSVQVNTLSSVVSFVEIVSSRDGTDTGRSRDATWQVRRTSVMTDEDADADDENEASGSKRAAVQARARPFN